MASIKIQLRNKINSEGTYPIVLNIIHNRKSKVISLGFKCLKKDWDNKKSQFKRSMPNHIQKNRIILQNQEKAFSILDGFKLENYDFNLDEFEQKFRGKTYTNINVWDYWEEKIEDLIKAGRTGNARAYKGTKNSFKKFYQDKNLSFRNITPSLLDKYVVFLRSNGNTDGGIGVKLRELRALYNDAIKTGAVDEKYYPFKAFKVSKFKSKSIKKALTREQVRRIENFDTTLYPHLVDTKNYFIFSYYSGGMNWKDMSILTWENIKDNRVLYKRSKTKQSFNIPVLEPMQQVLDFYKQSNPITNFIFPILLKENMTPMQIENRSTKTRKQFNRQLKEIASIVGIDESVTSYTIRHSFATNLRNAGISSDIISEAMGHQNVDITNAYLKEFGDDVKDDAMRKLLE